MAKTTSRSKSTKNVKLPVIDVDEALVNVPDSVNEEFESGGGENGGN